MNERKGAATAGGNPLTLLGNELKVGDKAPGFEATGNDMQPFSFSELAGKIVIISAVTSLDTSVCDVETRRFNTEAGKLGDEIAILTISMDLPFAQKRWCGAAGVDQVQVVSDYKTAEFGEKYGVLIKELHLHARTLFVVDRDGIVRYVQRVVENSNEPDYEAVLAAAKELL
ncbi:MAG: thiol peroxidase [Candidatus Eisenbacteria bacterium]